ncbi:unnamed protein product [Ceratitis capitata]|uniref:(Mediterranean fruit fly) hypothetical protein n=1 Tax=Ceratitis capitata TaxID=7213 RepID=A0A811UYY2_CERCA|nr:unnamed protein product [Ceratitis capitata]
MHIARNSAAWETLAVTEAEKRLWGQQKCCGTHTIIDDASTSNEYIHSCYADVDADADAGNGSESRLAMHECSELSVC